MKPYLHALPSIICMASVYALLAHGPIAQMAHYHAFADDSVLFGVPHAMDVLSNVSFALVALYGVFLLLQKLRFGPAEASFTAQAAFVICLAATAFGSAYYHLAPDDIRLFWDRLPIALACCSLLAAVRAEYQESADGTVALMELCVLLMAGLLSVVWWQRSGDLRPYLLIQGLALILIPLWLFIWKAERKHQLAFAIAMLLYMAAKAAEFFDAEILFGTHVVSGHTLKHLLAALAAGLIVSRMKVEKIDADTSGVSVIKIEVFKQTAS